MHLKFDHSSFSRSRHMVGARQYLNGSRDLTTPLSGTFQGQFDIHGLVLVTINLSYKSEVSISTQYEDTKGDTK